MGYSIFKSSVPAIDYTGTDNVTDVFSILSAIELKQIGMIHHATGIKKAVSLGLSVSKLVRAIAHNDGRVYHDKSFLRYIQAYDRDNKIIHRGENHKADGLFHRKNSTGNVHHGSYRYMLTRNGDRFITNVIDSFLDLILDESKSTVMEHDLLIEVNDLKRLLVRDRFILLSRCVGSKYRKLHISNTIIDNGVTRVYGLMTMLTSDARTNLGFKQYDMTSALQSIVIEQLETHGLDVKKKYPQHLKLVKDRKDFRMTIMKDTSKDMAWVKKKLTSIDNGGSVGEKWEELSPTLKAYKDESYDFVIDYLECVPTKQLIRAQDLTYQADTSEYWVKKDIQKGKRFEDGRKKFGVFFHAWTQTERYIRDLIKQHFTGYCHDIHDAIATLEEVNLEVINQSISDAGFKYIKVE